MKPLGLSHQIFLQQYPICDVDGKSDGEKIKKFLKVDNIFGFIAEFRSRNPQGLCGLKVLLPSEWMIGSRRNPQGLCGLKARSMRESMPGSCRNPQGLRGLKALARSW